jgi:uncharacterized LabA/DUF88 family protein
MFFWRGVSLEKVCVFIDGSGFYFSLKRNNRVTRVDYHELSQALVGPDRELVRAYYYNSAYDPVLAPEQRRSQQPFLDSLSKTPCLEPRLGRLVPSQEGGFKEKGTSVLLSADLVYYATQGFFDTAIVITEDTDFAYVISKAKELGRHVEICLFKDSQPRELLREADTVIYLDKVLEMYSAKIFPEAEEDNIGNRIEDEPAPKKKDSKSGIVNGLKRFLN